MRLLHTQRDDGRAVLISQASHRCLTVLLRLLQKLVLLSTTATSSDWQRHYLADETTEHTERRRPCSADQPGISSPTHCSSAAAPETCAPVHNGNKLWLTETLSSWWDYCTHRETTAVRCWSARHLIAVSLFSCGCSRNLRSCSQWQQALTDNNNNNNTTTTVLQPLCSHSALTDTSS